MAHTAVSTTHIRSDEYKKLKGSREIWIGLFEVRPLDGNEAILNGALGAFVNVVGIGSDFCCFKSSAEQALTVSGFQVVASKDIGLLNERIAQDQLVEELATLASDLSDECPILFDEFQAFDDKYEH